ncbi:MAG: peroxidase-related enzyme [Bacteroidota bacterium]
MAWIRVINENEAEKELKTVYDAYKAPWGGVDNIVKIHSLDPKSIKVHMDLYRLLMYGRSPLSRAQREMIASTVSIANNCRYCINHHGDGLYRLTKNKAFVEQLRKEYKLAALSEPEKLMLDFAVELTLRPQANHEANVHALRTAGFTDEAILHIVLVISYFNFVNRIAQGLGVGLEEYWTEDGFSREELPMAHDRREE